MEREDFEILKKYLEEAAKAAAFKKTIAEKEILFRFWTKAIHELLINRKACFCQNGQSQICFLKLDQKTREQLMKDKNHLSFKSFADFFQEGKKQFLAGQN